jgi:hypothetical protein
MDATKLKAIASILVNGEASTDGELALHLYEQFAIGVPQALHVVTEYRRRFALVPVPLDDQVLPMIEQVLNAA